MKLPRHSPLLAALLSFVAGCSSGPAEIACGAGTHLDGDSCVPDSTDLTRPRVERAAVVGLSVEEEGQRAAFVGYPLTVALALDVQGEAFRSEVVVGLESADGAVACTLGAIQIDAPDHPAGSDPLQLSKELLVQSPCASLAGQSGVRVWVSFDPFDKVNVAGRPPIPAAESLSAEFFRPSRLDLTNCKGPASHPDTCATALDVNASPGLDLSLRRLTLDSSVAVVHTRFRPDETVPADDPDAQGLEPATPAPFDPEYGLPTAPQFSVSTEMLLYGATTAAGSPALGDDQVSLKFALRPDRARAPDGLPDEIYDWVPLSVERQTLSEGTKDGTPSVSLERLQEQFVRSIASATVLHKDSPVFIDGAARQRVLTLRDKVRNYELQACAVPRFAEGSWEPDAAANNCVTLPVVVLEEQHEAATSSEPKAPGAATLLFDKDYESSSGSTDSMKITGRVYVNTGCSTSTCRAEAGSSLKIKGKWIDAIDGDGDGNVTLFSFYAYGQSAIVAQDPTMALAKLKIAGLTVWDRQKPLEEGVTGSLPAPELSIPYHIIGGEGCYDGLCADFGVSIEPTVSLTTTFLFKETVAQPGCKGGRSTPGGRCFVAEAAEVPWDVAEAACLEKHGHLAEIQSADEQLAARDAMVDKGLTRAWLGARRKLEDCSPYLAQATLCGTSSFCDVSWARFNLCQLIDSTMLMVWGANGSVSSGNYQPWALGYSGGSGRPSAGLVLRPDATWSELSPSYPLGFVCEYAKEYDLSTTITPGFSVPISVEGSAYLKSAKSLSVGAYGTVSALNIDFPNTFGLRWSFENLGAGAPKPTALEQFKMRSSLYYKSSLKLSGLNGEVGFKLLGESIPIIEWDGITYASYDLWSAQKTMLIP
jgi:hypothetical protein